MTYRSITIIGVGLIGGSLAKLIRNTYPDVTLTGVDLPEVLSDLEGDSLFDKVAPVAELEDAVRNADLVILALPCSKIIEMLPAVISNCSPGTLVTDVGSVKSAVMDAAADADAGRPDVYFIGGHPIGGSEKQGYESSSADLLRGVRYIVTPDDRMPQDIKNSFVEFLSDMGFQVIEKTADEHDRLIAFTSHLPQVVSIALGIAAGRGGGSETVGSGLKSTTRLASSPAQMWNEIFNLNKENVLAAIDQYSERLAQLRREIENGDVTDSFEEAAAAVRKLFDE